MIQRLATLLALAMTLGGCAQYELAPSVTADYEIEVLFSNVGGQYCPTSLKLRGQNKALECDASLARGARGTNVTFAGGLCIDQGRAPTSIAWYTRKKGRRDAPPFAIVYGSGNPGLPSTGDEREQYVEFTIADNPMPDIGSYAYLIAAADDDCELDPRILITGTTYFRMNGDGPMPEDETIQLDDVDDYLSPRPIFDLQ